MRTLPRRLTLDQWDQRYAELVRDGMHEPPYGGPLRRHIELEGDVRLRQLQFDDSSASLRLWNFLLTENNRLRLARDRGEKLVGTMKDLGTVPVMAYALPCMRAFYPDGAWWTPCLMECSDRLLGEAEAAGIDACFCPVRAMLGAMQNEEHFPRPDLLICSAGAICDDFSAIAQRLERMGRSILWWEIPRRRPPESDESSCPLLGNLSAARIQVDCVREELQRVGTALGELAGHDLDEATLRSGIKAANDVRRLLQRLRQTVYSAPTAPLPALEMLIAEMLAVHYCSDREECQCVLTELLTEVSVRTENQSYVTNEDAVRVFWVNPVADLRAMNLLEDCGGRLCGSDFMFTHALDSIPEDLPPWEALARTALADPMVGSAFERANRIAIECRQYDAEAVIVARIPGASHCPWESVQIRDSVQAQTGLPVVELEFPPVSDAMIPTLTTRLQAAMEIARSRRHT